MDNYKTPVNGHGAYGWTNYETWSVASWIQNGEGLYEIAKEFKNLGYVAFAENMREFGCVETPDNVAFDNSNLDIKELDEMLVEM